MSGSSKWAAGVWEQYAEDEGGDGFVEWSRHSTETLARAAALRYAGQRSPRTGGSLSWSGGVRAPGGHVQWVARDGT